MRKSLLVALISIALMAGFATVAAGATLPPYKVTITTSSTTSQAGRFVTVSGKVVGARAVGKPVRIQRKYVGGAWVTVAKVLVRANGTFSARVETPRGGTTSFRALKARSTVRSAGVSNVRALKVYEWLYLAHQGPYVIFGEVLMPIELQFNGTLYDHSIALYNGDATMLYKLGGLCTTFTTRAGYRNPDLDPADDLTLNVSSGGSPASTVISTDTTVTVNHSVASSNYLRIEFVSVDPAYVAGLANPRVYCNADRLPAYNTSDF